MKAIVFGLGLLCALSSNTARGDIIYDLFFRAAGLADGINTTEIVASGQVFSGVNVVLRETVSGGSASIFGDDTLITGSNNVDNRAGNISGYSADVVAMGANGTFSNLSLISTNGAPNAFNDANTLGYLVLGAGLGQPGRMATFVNSSVREIVLGTVDLTAPTIGSTTFTVQDFDSINSGDFSTFSSVDGLEAAAVASGGSFNGRSLTLVAVPEPSGLLLVGSGSGLALVRRRTKRSSTE